MGIRYTYLTQNEVLGGSNPPLPTNHVGVVQGDMEALKTLILSGSIPDADTKLRGALRKSSDTIAATSSLIHAPQT
jgi:hypothetical protein